MSEEDKRLQRSRTNRMLAGVSGGIGRYYEFNPTIIRILFVFFSLFIGGGLLVYIILWIVIPEEPETAEQTDEVLTAEGE